MNPEVDSYLSESEAWREELIKLRSILLGCSLVEELKWSSPCYTFGTSNVVLLGRLKDSCVLSFLKGALLKDPEGILRKPGKNTQAGRVIRFVSVREIEELEPVLAAYIREAIEVEKAGLKVEYAKADELEYPEELRAKLEADPALRSSFEALSPGRKRGYVLHVSAPKKSVSRISRIEKCRSRILAGKGIHDCICGRSKKMPSCDGSHKFAD